MGHDVILTAPPGAARKTRLLAFNQYQLIGRLFWRHGVALQVT
jgi:hypothetical protein